MSIVLPRTEASKSVVEEGELSGERKQKGSPASRERQARHRGSCRELPGQRRKEGRQAHKGRRHSRRSYHGTQLLTTSNHSACIPGLALAGANAYWLWTEHWEHWSHMPPLEERTEYPYQNIRTKNFPWGDGDKTLL